jgi:chitin disaccharide deacetylase
MKRLLVVADDLGLTLGVNRGIAAAFREGILTSASLLTNTPHFDAALALVRELPGLKVGIHLTLVGGVPLLPPESVPSLAPRGGRFRSSWRRFLPAWLAGRIRKEEVRAEWRAQVWRAVEQGLRPAHLDSHQHLHLLPGLRLIATDLCREFGIPRLRIIREVGPSAPEVPASRRLVRVALSRLSPRPGATDASPRSCDHFLGAAEAGRLGLPLLLAALRRVPDGWTELVTHPGISDPELTRDYPWGYSWEAELAALCSGEARREIARLGIALDRKAPPGEENARE